MSLIILRALLAVALYFMALAAMLCGVRGDMPRANLKQNLLTGLASSAIAFLCGLACVVPYLPREDLSPMLPAVGLPLLGCGLGLLGLLWFMVILCTRAIPELTYQDGKKAALEKRRTHPPVSPKNSAI